MTIRVYNTLTKEKETFVPIEDGKVRMYACGPTVYNYIHVGNGRMTVVFDVIRRYFEYRGYEVTYVHNFTDVDDKMIKAANEMGITVLDVAEKFIHEYLTDLKSLGVKRAHVNPRVTEHIPEIIDFIQGLIDKGLAYEVEGDVYYRVLKFQDYGKLSRQPIEDLLSGARVEIGENKENPLDFALWKSAKPGEIYWESPWGKGRPGWHIECSAMAMKYLGETFDIHGGGRDLCFPHHENEIAQSEGLTGKPLAHYWIHNGFVNIDNEKMSKSLGNFVLVRDAIKAFGGPVLRFFYLSTHYRNPINYSPEILEAAKNGLERMRTAYQNILHIRSLFAADEKDGLIGDEVQQTLERLRLQFIEAMDDDFNTADAISVIFELTKWINTYIAAQKFVKAEVEAFIQLFEELTDVLGIELNVKDEMLDHEIEALIEERNQARIQRNFARADEIRDLLKAKGIILEDTPQGVRYRREH